MSALFILKRVSIIPFLHYSSKTEYPKNITKNKCLMLPIIVQVPQKASYALFLGTPKASPEVNSLKRNEHMLQLYSL